MCALLVTLLSSVACRTFNSVSHWYQSVVALETNEVCCNVSFFNGGAKVYDFKSLGAVNSNYKVVTTWSFQKPAVHTVN